MLPSKEDLESMRLLINNAHIEDFEGLSSSEMHYLLYSTFDPESPLKINTHLPDEILSQIPFFRLTEVFLKIIQRDQYIKLTQLGALPKKVLVELYDQRLILDRGIETGITKLTREIDCLSLSALHYNTVFAGLARKSNGKLYLTRLAQDAMSKQNRNALFIKTLCAYTEKLAWSNFDGYPPLPVGNLGWGFTVILLLKYGSESHQLSYYAEKYIRAFPNLLRDFPQRQYSTPKEDLIRCYCLRSFERFMEWWGFVNIEPKDHFLFDLNQNISVTPVLKEVFNYSD
ncbi:MAG: hypothetical protein MUF75_03400 [Bacteroidia bacterium]|jgi:hypothetical protein|nr:hypothetical protein [Bacteroidia bacterium]